ncbi:exopolysaccharide transport family protein [Bosea sp. 2RAB26]|uniref:exopolysaccharide transport family protein n=1 Tax=Bosea sp. 2RAB26 TaxID=3237476 RepID=UPI003F8E58A5
MKRSVMFTTETADGELSRTEQAGSRTEPAAGGAVPSALARLTNPAWLFQTLWSRKGLIIAAALAGALLAALASLFIPPKYVSTAQLFIDPRDLRVLQNEVSPNAVGSDPTSLTAYLESQARIIASDSIKARVVKSEGLDKDPEFGGEAPKSGLGRLLSGSSTSSRDGLLYALAALDKNVTVRRGERTFVIDISVTSRDPEKAARIANALATAYLDDQASVRADAAQRATGALTGRLEELRNRLRIAEEKAEKYKEANSLVGAGGKSIGEEQLALNNAQLVALRTRVSEAKAKYDQTLATRASSIEAGAIPEAVASNTMTALRSQLGAALSKEADLLASLGSRHPALAAAQAQVRDARRQINEELARIARAAKIEYDRAVDAERQIARRVEELTRQQYSAGRASVQLRELEREIESSRAVYDAFLRRARETGELSGIDTTNARVISMAMPALEKSGVSRRTVVMLGGIAGGGLGAIAALGLALFGGSLPAPPAGLRRWPFRNRHEPVAAQASPPPAPADPVPVVAAATEPPSPDAVAAPARTGWRRFMAIQGGQPARTPEVVRAPAAPPLALLAKLPAVRHRRWRRDGEVRSVFQAKAHLVDVIDKPNASFARAIRGIRTELASQGSPSRRVFVVGLRRNAGASTLALNLALDAAQAGLPAMLVDAGLGGNSLTSVFAPDAQAGVHEIVSGSASLIRAALQDEGTGLFFVPRKGHPELVTAEQISHDFFSAARRFGPVFIDGASLGSDAFTERFADAVDDIVLVVREGEVGAGELQQASTALGRNAAKIRGFVSNEA